MKPQPPTCIRKMSIRKLSLPFLLVLCILSCQAKTSAKIYVSSTEGNDRNNGQTPATPIRSLDAAIKKSDDIYLKRGDIFYGNIELKGKSLHAYGPGPRPVICGYKRIVKPKWKKAGKNVWKINLRDDNFTGVDTRGSSVLNNVGCIHEYDRDLIHGRKVEKRNELRRDWDMWQVSELANDKVRPQQFDELYLYLKQNPNKLKLEFSTGVNGVLLKNGTMEGIEVRGFGRHGIAAYTHSTIRDCRIDAIGGMMQIGSKNYVCLGNGIEFWVNLEPVEDCLVEDSYISRCYDCGMTIQGSENSKYTPRNILITNNFITECCQAWEDFLNNGKQYDNCRFKGNIAANCGNTSGFGYPDSRFIFCNVLGHNHRVRNGMIIENNTFIGGNYYSASPSVPEYKSNIWRNNTLITSRGHWILGYYTGKKDVIYLPRERGSHRTLEAATDAAIKQYREKTGDQSTVFTIKSDEEVEAMIAQYKQRYSGKK